MKSLYLVKIMIAIIIGAFLFNACEKQDSGNMSEDNGSISNLKSGGPGGYALYLDGDDDYVMVPDDPSLDITDEFTIAAWINIEQYKEWASIVTKGEDAEEPWPASYNNYTIHQSGPTYMEGNEFGHLRFTCDQSSLPQNPLPESTTIIPLDEWHFVAVTWDGETIKFYLDGEPDGSTEFTGTLQPNDESLYIGVDFPGGDEYWKGYIDEVRIWNKALKQTHIHAAMNGSATPIASALVGYWRFDEGKGTIAKDRSKYKNNGELIGGATWVKL